MVSLKEGKKRHVVKQLFPAGEEGMGAGNLRPSRLFSHLLHQMLCICILSKAPFQAKTPF